MDEIIGQNRYSQQQQKLLQKDKVQFMDPHAHRVKPPLSGFASVGCMLFTGCYNYKID